MKQNVKILRKFDREKQRYDAKIAAGKKPGFELAPPAVIDLELIKGNIDHLLNRLAEHYKTLLVEEQKRDFEAGTVGCVDYLMENASGVTNRVTHRVAKHRAIRLMEEVGIAEPHKRYK